MMAICGKINLSGALEVKGQLPAANMKKINIDTGTEGQLPASRVSGLPSFAANVGFGQPFYGKSAPEGWFACDGTIMSAQEQTDYPELKTHLEANDPGGDARFPNIPLGGSPVMIDTTGAPDVRFDELGTAVTNYVGETDNTLGVGGVPAHIHKAKQQLKQVSTGGTSTQVSLVSGDQSSEFSTLENTGGGGAHNNMQPYSCWLWCINGGAKATA